MTDLLAAANTDTGQIRQANEDAYFVGDTIFAVADGMGGHLAGEVASAMALEPIEQLDGKVFPDASAANEALTGAVREANSEVSRRASNEPRFRGMGTTLTAALIEGRRLHIGHVGDSRAYLLRNGDFNQLTDDHTLVQHLIDEGQITKEEAATHPQRSIITRAIGVAPTIEVDTMSLDLEEGDVVLLCSDGLTGVVSDQQIQRSIESEGDDNATVQGLIDLANRAGGPDNITVVLLRYGEPTSVATAASERDTGKIDMTEEDGGEEPEGDGPVIVRTGDQSENGNWAERLGRLGQLGHDRDGRFDDTPSGPPRWQRWGAVLLALAVVLALLIGGGQYLLSRSFYVGVEDERVVIFQGIPAELGPIELSRVHEETSLDVGDLPEFVRSNLEDDGVHAADLSDARRIVAQYEEMTADVGGESAP